MAGGAPRDTPPSCNLSLHGPHGTADGMRPGPGMLSAPLTRDVDACSPRLAFLQVKLCSDKTLALHNLTCSKSGASESWRDLHSEGRRVLLASCQSSADHHGDLYVER